MARIFRLLAWTSIVLWVALVMLSLGLVLERPDSGSRVGDLVVAVGLYLWLGIGGLLPAAALFSIAADALKIREIVEWWDLTRGDPRSR